MDLRSFFESMGLLVWSTLSLVCIIVIVGKVSTITTTNLLLVLILGTLAFRMFVESASDVTHDVTDAAMTIVSYFIMKKGE